MKLILKIIVILYSSFLYSQNKDSIILKIDIDKLKKEASNNFDIYFKNTLANDSVFKTQPHNYEFLTKYEPIKDSLTLMNIPIFDIILPTNNLKNNNYLNIFNFNYSENQIIFVKNKENYIVSEFLSYKDVNKISKTSFLTFNDNYIDYIGSRLTEYSVYNFKKNFYFFSKKTNGLFEFDNGKLYVIFKILNSKINEDCISNFDTLKLNGVKKPDCIDFFKIEYNTYLKKLNGYGLYDPAFEKNPTLRAGNMYAGAIYKGQAYFLGNNRESRLHSVQNWIHKNLFPTPYFPDRGLPSQTYSFYGTYSNRYLFY